MTATGDAACGDTCALAPTLWPGLEVLLLSMSRDIKVLKDNIDHVGRDLSEIKATVKELLCAAGPGNACRADIAQDWGGCTAANRRGAMDGNTCYSVNVPKENEACGNSCHERLLN